MSFEPRESVVTLQARLRRTRRPRLLLKTARFGQADYVRERDLRHVLRLPAAPPPGPATVGLLLDLEAEEEVRRTRPTAEPGDAWGAARHVELLIALIAESRLMAVAVAGPAAMAGRTANGPAGRPSDRASDPSSDRLPEPVKALRIAR